MLRQRNGVHERSKDSHDQRLSEGPLWVLTQERWDEIDDPEGDSRGIVGRGEEEKEGLEGLEGNERGHLGGWSRGEMSRGDNSSGGGIEREDEGRQRG